MQPGSVQTVYSAHTTRLQHLFRCPLGGRTSMPDRDWYDGVSIRESTCRNPGNLGAVRGSVYVLFGQLSKRGFVDRLREPVPAPFLKV